MIEVAKATILVLSVLMLAGGAMGFIRKKSKVSLIAGGASAILLLASFFISLNNARTGLAIADGIALTLMIVFAVRLAKTRVLMPGAAIFVICLIGLVLMTTGLVSLP